MNNTPTTHRFVAVLNRKVEIGRLMNALGHMTVGLAITHKDELEALRIQTYVDKDQSLHPNISDNPFIVLKADNGNKLRTLRQALIEKGIKYVDFIDTMIEGTFVEQHQRTNETPEAELEYFGVCFFADNETARELTKKFSLFQ